MKKFFTNLLLMLVLGVSGAWATDVPYNVGATDKTSDFRAAESDAYTLTGDGTVSYTFTNNVVTTGANWDNWQLFCTNASESASDGDSNNTNRYFRLRADNWEQVVGTNTMSWVTGDYWTNFMTWNDGATVNMTIVRKGSYIYVYAKSTSTANVVYTESFTYQLSDASATTKFFLVNGYHNYINITAQSTSTATDLPTGATFQCANVDFRNAISENVSKGLNNSMTLSNTTTAPIFELGYTASGAETVSGDVLRVGNGKGTVTIPEAQRAGTRDKVTISFDMWFGALNGKNAGFYLYDANGGKIAGYEGNFYSTKTASVNDFSLDPTKFNSVGSSSASNNAICVDANKTSISITLDYSTGKMSITQSTNGSVKQTKSDIAMTNTNPLASFVVTSNYNNADRRCWFDNLLINTTKGDYSVASTTYTIKYQDGSGNDLKDSSTGNATLVGQTFDITEADKATIAKDGHKYLYDATSTGTTAKVAVSDATQNVIILKFKQAAEYAYNVKAVDANGTVIKNLCSGTAYEGDANKYYFNKVFKEDSNYYVTNESSYSVDLTDAADKKIVYALDANIVAFEEVGTGTNANYSGGGNTSLNAKLADVTVNAGSYIATIYVVSKAGNGSNHRGEKVYAGADVVASIADNIDGARELGFDVANDNTEVYVIGSGTSNYGDNIDYVILRKASKASMACASKKMGTFCAPFAVTLPANIKAYSATANASSVTLTKIADPAAVLAACTPVVIYNEGDADLASTTLYGVSTTTDTYKTAGALTGFYGTAGQIPANSYVLATVDGAQGFYKVSTAATGKANRCYVTAGGSGAKLAINVSDDEMATAIKVLEQNPEAKTATLKHIQNGKLIIETANGTFNAAGARIK